MTSSTPDEAPLLISDTQFNFFHDYTVILDHPIADVFNVLGKGTNMEAPVRLSSLCTEFRLTRANTVSLPKSTSLSESYLVRTQPPVSPGEVPPNSRALPRQFFHLEETVPILLGFTKCVVIEGAHTWDEDAKVALYESESGMVIVWKLRMFEGFEEDGRKKTKVHEVIKGQCPVLLKWMVQKETAEKHKAHMEMYHTLF